MENGGVFLDHDWERRLVGGKKGVEKEQIWRGGMVCQ